MRIRNHMLLRYLPFRSLLQRRQFTSTANSTRIEFTQGGAQNCGDLPAYLPPQIWTSKSSTSKNVTYTTKRNEREQYHCDCPGFRYRKNCRHVDVARQSTVQIELQRRETNGITALNGDGDDADGATSSLTSLVVGIDEAGAGPVLGPMVFCAVVLSKRTENLLKQEGVKDSKDVPPKKRHLLRQLILEAAVEYETVVVEAQDIDRRRANGESMNAIKVHSVNTLLKSLRAKPTTAYVDAFDNIATKHNASFQASLKEAGCDNTIVVSEHRADSKYTVVGAASLIAKTERDDRIRAMEKEQGTPLGSGYPSDPKTLAFLAKCKGTFPEFVRQSWKTVDRFRV
jgi:ribonuclease HII